MFMSVYECAWVDVYENAYVNVTMYMTICVCVSVHKSILDREYVRNGDEAMNVN